MANITIQIPDALVTRVQDAFTADAGWQEQIPDPDDPTKTITNPETKNQLVQRRLREYLKSVVGRHEAQKAAGEAEKKAWDAIG